MKTSFKNYKRERGVALMVALLFLLVVTIISVTAARNSSVSLKISSNIQDQNNSLQSAEAGLFATLALADTANDPFGSQNQVDPFDGIGSDPLDNLNDPNSVETVVNLSVRDRACPRPRFDRGGYSLGTFACDYYRVDAVHDVPQRARTQASLGVVKTILGGK